MENLLFSEWPMHVVNADLARGIWYDQRVHKDLNQSGHHRMHGPNRAADLFEDPRFDWHFVLEESARFEQLVNAMDWQIPWNCAIQIGCNRHTDSMQCHHLFRKQILREQLLNAIRTVRPDRNLHGQRGADHFADGRYLIAMEMYGQQEQHLAQGAARARALAEEGILANEPLQPFHSLVLQWNRRN